MIAPNSVISYLDLIKLSTTLLKTNSKSTSPKFNSCTQVRGESKPKASPTCTSQMSENHSILAKTKTPRLKNTIIFGLD